MVTHVEVGGDYMKRDMNKVSNLLDIFQMPFFLVMELDVNPKF